MDCSKFNSELQKMLEKASYAAAPEFSEHMGTCPSCQRAYTKVKLLQEAISSEQKTAPNLFLEGRIMERIRAEVKNTIQIRPLRWETAVASLVAGVALGLIIGTTSYVSTTHLSDSSLISAISVQQDTEDTALEEYIFTTENNK